MNNEWIPVDNEMSNVPAVMDDQPNFIVDLTSRETTFCSFEAKTEEEKAVLFKAMNNPEKRLGDCINMTIKVKDLYCEVVKCEDRNTGRKIACPRIVVIDDKGVGYQAVSLGVYGAIKKLIQVFGPPTWEKPIPVEIKQITKGENKLLTFDIKMK